MQWPLVFENPLVDADIRALSDNDKTRLLASYLYRQSGLMQHFDQHCQARLQALFVRGLVAAVSGTPEDVGHCMSEVHAQIPDTDNYPEQEGAFAQNLMISLWYLLSFARQADIGLLQSAVNAALDNIDLIHYALDEDYDEPAVVAREVVVVRQMLRRLRAGVACSGDSRADIVELASGLML